MKTINDYLQEFDEVWKSCWVEDIHTEARESLKNHYHKALTEALESVRLEVKEFEETTGVDMTANHARVMGYNAAKAEVDEKINEILGL